MNPTETMQQAIAYHQAGQLADAESLYRSVLQIQPTHPDANHNLGVLALQMGQPSAALPFLQTAWEINPANGQYWLSLAECHVRLQAWDKAETLLNEAVGKGLQHPAVAELKSRIQAGRGLSDSGSDTEMAADLAQVDALREVGQWQQAAEAARMIVTAAPERADAWAMLALVLPQLQQVNDADQAAQKALTLAPQNTVALRALAAIRLRQQRIDEAATLADQALMQSPDCPRALTVLASIRMAQGRISDADNLLTRAFNIAPLAEIHAARALFEARRNHVPAAIAQAESAVAKKPFLTAVWQLLASLYRQAGQTDSVCLALERVIAYEPANAMALSDLGYTYRQIGRQEDALTVLARAVALSPGLASAWVNYGATLQAAHRGAEAMEAYQKALAINPSQGEVHNNLGALYKEEGDVEKAYASFDAACRFLPQRGEMHVNRGYALMQLDRLDEAEAAFSQAGKCEPRSSTVLLGQASIAAQRKNWTHAEHMLQQALDIAPEKPEIWCQLGAVLTSTQRYEEAATAYGKALAIHPDSVGGHHGLASLCLAQGKILQALEAYRRVLRIKETAETKKQFFHCVKNVHFVENDADMHPLLARALSEPWGRPHDLATTAISLIKLQSQIADCIRRVNDAWPQRLRPKKCLATRIFLPYPMMFCCSLCWRMRRHAIWHWSAS